MKLLTFVGMNVGGSVGWSLGSRFGTWPALGICCVGSIIGIYLGWKLARQLFE